MAMARSRMRTVRTPVPTPKPVVTDSGSRFDTFFMEADKATGATGGGDYYNADPSLSAALTGSAGTAGGDYYSSVPSVSVSVGRGTGGGDYYGSTPSPVVVGGGTGGGDYYTTAPSSTVPAGGGTGSVDYYSSSPTNVTQPKFRQPGLADTAPITTPPVVTAGGTTGADYYTSSPTPPPVAAGGGTGGADYYTPTPTPVVSTPVGGGTGGGDYYNTAPTTTTIAQPGLADTPPVTTTTGGGTGGADYYTPTPTPDPVVTNTGGGTGGADYYTPTPTTTTVATGGGTGGADYYTPDPTPPPATVGGGTGGADYYTAEPTPTGGGTGGADYYTAEPSPKPVNTGAAPISDTTDPLAAVPPATLPGVDYYGPTRSDGTTETENDQVDYYGPTRSDGTTEGEAPSYIDYYNPTTATTTNVGGTTTNVGDQSLRLDQGPIRMDVGDTTVNVNEAGATQGQQDIDAARARHADTYFTHLGNRLDTDLTNEFDRTRYANTPELEMDPILDYTARLREPVIKQAEENVGTPGFEFNELDTGRGTVLGNLQDQYRAGGRADLGSAALTADPNNLRTALESNVNRIGQANPYDTRRDDIIAGQDAQVDRMFDEEFARIENAFAVNNNLGSPAYIKAMQDLNARKAEAKLGIRSEFGQAAAAQDESMARGRLEDIEGAIASRRAGEMGEEQVQGLRRQGALGAGSYIGTEQFEQDLRGQGMEEAARRSRLQDAGQVLSAEQDQVMRDMLYQQQLQEQANQAYYRNLKAEEDAMYRPYQYQDAGLAMAMGAMGAPVDIGAAVGAYGSAGQYAGNAAEQAELWRAIMSEL